MGNPSMKFAPRDRSSARTLSTSASASGTRLASAGRDRIVAEAAPLQHTASTFTSAIAPPVHALADSPRPALQSAGSNGSVAHQRPANATFNRGQQVFGPGDGHGLIHIVRSGCIRLYKTLPDGRSINVGLLGPNTIFAQEVRGDTIARGTSAEALTTTTLSIVEEHDLARLIAASPDLAMAVVSGMGRRVTELQTLVEQLLVRDTSVRLASTLISLAELLGQSHDHGMRAIALPLTHQGLANMIGSNRVTVTRKLIEFQRNRIVMSTGRTTLAVDMQRLRDLIESPLPEQPDPSVDRVDGVESAPRPGDNVMSTG